MTMTGKNEVLGETPVLVPLCSPKVLQGGFQDRTRASVVSERRHGSIIDVHCYSQLHCL